MGNIRSDHRDPQEKRQERVTLSVCLLAFSSKRPEGSNSRHLLSPGSGGQESKPRYLRDWSLLRIVRQDLDLFQDLSAACTRLSSPAFPHVLFPLCVSVPRSPLSRGHQSYGIGATLVTSF